MEIVERSVVVVVEEEEEVGIRLNEWGWAQNVFRSRSTA